MLSRTSQTTRGYNLSRIIKITRTEEPNSHKADIILHNTDGALTSLDFEHYQAVISKGYKTGVARTAWAANTAYAIDDIRVPTTANGYQYRCSVAGTSGSSEPTWPTALGVTVGDGAGALVWEMDGNSGDEYSRAAPLRVRVQETYSGMGIARCILRCIGLQDQLKEDRAIAEYTQESTDTNTVKTLISAVCAASTGLSSAYNGYAVITVVYDSEDSLIDSFIPADYFSISMNENRWDKITELLGYTSCKARFENDGKLHIFVPRMTSKTWVANTAYVVNNYAQPVTPNDNWAYQCTTAGTSHASTEPTWPTTEGGTVTDGTVVWTARGFHYEYKWKVSGDHLFWNKSIRLRFINPNKIIVRTPSDYATQYTGNATSATSNALAEKTRTVYARLVSNAQCTSIASAMIEQLELDDEKGIVRVPPNVGQELWDYVKVTDSILSDNNIGNVQYISDEFEVFPNSNQRPTWNMVISFGKVTQQSLQMAGISAGKEVGMSTEQIFRLFDGLASAIWDIRLAFNNFLIVLNQRMATTTNVNEGTSMAKFVSPNSLATSIYGERIIYLKVLADDTALTTGDGKMYFTIPDIMDGWKLIDADASVVTVSSSGLPTIQIANVTDAVDMLSTKITIDANEKTSYTAATPPVIDTAKDDVATGDEIRIDCDVAGTGTKGLNVILTFLTQV